MKKRFPALFVKGAAMGAADAVPGMSGGTVAFISGIYQELIATLSKLGPGVWRVWRKDGLAGVYRYLNLEFLIPLLTGIAVSLFSVAHLALWLLDRYPLLLDGFFFGLVAASALVVHASMRGWSLWYLLPLVGGLLVAQALPGLMPTLLQIGNPSLLLFLAGAIAISAMLLPGVSGSFLLLAMGLYATIMDAIRGLDLLVLGIFGAGCLVGLGLFSRLLSYLLSRHHGATLQALLGFIIGALPILWPWRELLEYRQTADGTLVALEYRFLMPDSYASLVGGPSHWPAVVISMLAGLLLVLAVNRNSPSS